MSIGIRFCREHLPGGRRNPYPLFEPAKRVARSITVDWMLLRALGFKSERTENCGNLVLLEMLNEHLHKGTIHR